MNDGRIEDALCDATDTRNVTIGAGVLSSVAEVFEYGFGDSSVVVVADEDTFAVAGEEVTRVLREAGCELVEPYIFPREPRLYAGYA
ncbi:MAG: sn-glycerol-1-phosphate dehydrogenase, partial [Rubrobacter sp.]|nr:sn-glycerol-1-phosphate dehydrogenase [Rubrobacter sp.]